MNNIKLYALAALASVLLVHGTTVLACGDDEVALAAPEQPSSTRTDKRQKADPELVEIFGAQTALAAAPVSAPSDYREGDGCRRVVQDQ